MHYEEAEAALYGTYTVMELFRDREMTAPLRRTTVTT